MSTPLAIVGAGGHACDMLDLVDAINAHGHHYEVVGLFADWVPEPERLVERGISCAGSLADLARQTHLAVVIGIAWPAGREKLATAGVGGERQFATLIHPSATVPKATVLGEGTVIAAGARISGNVRIGRHVYIGQNVVVGHDSRIGSFTSVLPGAIVSGDVRLGEGVLVASAAFVKERVNVGDASTLGAGGVLLRDLSAGTTAVGVPARPLTTRGGDPFRR